MNSIVEEALIEAKKTEQELNTKLHSALGFAGFSSKISAALHFIENIHTQNLSSEKNNLINALSVANILASMSMDIDAIIAGLFYAFRLHDDVSYKDVGSHFGEEVVYLTSKLNTLDRIKFRKSVVSKKDFINRLVDIVGGDTRVFSIKLADRLHKMRSIQASPINDSKKQIAQETMKVYVPLSERFGMQVIKNELQELSFSILSPAAKQSIVLRLSAFRRGCIKLIPGIIKSLKTLMDQHNIEADIFGREKTPYSIFDKMKRKSISFRQISDVIAFRVLVNDMNSCYLALGAIHTHYQNLPGHFKDFISAPKENNYRSLHTIVVGPDNKIMEVQIRTYEMQNFAEYGLAAHECYKKQHKFKGADVTLPMHKSAYINDLPVSFGFNDSIDSGRAITREYGLSNEYRKSTYSVLSRAVGCQTLQDNTYNSNQYSLSDFDNSYDLTPHSSSIYFTVQNSPGALADVAKEIANYSVNIDNIKTLKKTDISSDIRVDLTLKNIKQLTVVLDVLQNKRYISCVSVFN